MLEHSFKKYEIVLKIDTLMDVVLLDAERLWIELKGGCARLPESSFISIDKRNAVNNPSGIIDLT